MQNFQKPKIGKKLKICIVHSCWKIKLAETKIAPHNTHENDPDRIKASSRLNEEESGDEKTEERGDNHEAEANIQTEDFCRRQTKNKMNYSEGGRSFKRINNTTRTKMLMSMILVLGLKLELINLERLSYEMA